MAALRSRGQPPHATAQRNSLFFSRFPPASRYDPDVPVWAEATVLVALGVVSGVINVVAGGGSFLVLPALIFLGLPPALANGTNRVGILAQNLAGVVGFHGHGLFRWRADLMLCVPALAGAALGASAAITLPDAAFRRLLSLAMIAVALWAVVKDAGPEEGTRQPGARPAVSAARSPHWLVLLGFFAIGLYGGLVQAGIGFFVLAVASMAGEDLVRASALKVLSVLLITVLSLAIFAVAAQVDWPRGLALGIGNAIGGTWGVRLTVLQGHAWLQRVVTATIIAFAVLLWFA
jgi:uncharacterized membrane protein YfcA